MSRKIYKYPVGIKGSQGVMMPVGAEILTVQVQNGTPCLWALVDIDKPVVMRHIHTYGTGHDIEPADYDYIGTYQLYDGQAVFHVFEMIS